MADQRLKTAGLRGSPPRAAGPTRRRGPSRGQRKYGHLWFIVPGLAFFMAVMIGPAIFAVGVSLTSWSGLGKDFSFVGLQNYINALSYWPFYRAALNNLTIFISILIFQHTFGLFIAVQLNAKPKFMELYNSFAVVTKAKRAAQLQDAFKVQGVPALGINGRFYTDGSLAGSMERALQVTEFLLSEIRKGR